ncbi:hypothetical protein [Candidatus Puniceispirillum marinum]|uniref:Polysaccharide biosynthesis protein CapD n=1 Tax=Puniceispirillum marinum (strain IMCC1322) TaxID=488538 RepID=D5BS14_PUNMI|nr:hypothetical protein [Candidatus Puniceispirillum marinum]ADE39061.1 polysaccharide biosynthesis protein CapD [Candidatus Puniceispirillum marinum IMCC1322]
MARRTHRSLGEMISTVSFYGVSAGAFVHGMASLEVDEPLYKTVLIFTASFLCFLGGARFSIANMFDQSQRHKK